ncbi:LOW QUALITY PROTEIN: cytochrome P450 4V2-like [Polymixia lowei]
MDKAYAYKYEVIYERAEYISYIELDSESGMRKRRAFLDTLLKTTDKDGNKLSRQDVQEEVDTFMFRGHNTTATAVNWAVHLLGSYPEVHRKVQQELREVFDGFKVPKGAKAIVVTYALHRDPRSFLSPEEFRPGRFLLGNSVGRHPYAFISFSATLCNCIGQRFATMEETVIPASILRYFNTEACQKGEGLRTLREIILRPEKAVWIKLERRKPQTPP